jgi:hypothetical protein
MNSKNDLIFKYIEGDMNERERILFESELKNSISLQKELDRYKAIYTKFSAYKDISADEDYFINMVPRFRSKLPGEIKKFPLPRFAFGSAVVIVTALFMFLLLNKNVYVSNIADTIDERGLTELLNNYSPELLQSEIPADAVVDSTINALYLNEINISPEAESYYFDDKKPDISVITKDIDEKEADNIYNEIINKKYF